MTAHQTTVCVLAAGMCALVVLPAVGGAATSVPSSAPVLQYNQRYVLQQLDNDTIVVLDTAEGKVWTGLMAQYGFKTWRFYDLHAVATERKVPETAPPAVFAQRTVHARYTVHVFAGFVAFVDTLTGRVWTCRHSKGILDMWKCHSVATGAGDQEQ